MRTRPRPTTKRPLEAFELADRGDEGTVAAMVSLVMAMRASEIVSRSVRDLDDEGQLLWDPGDEDGGGQADVSAPQRSCNLCLLDIIRGKKPTTNLRGPPSAVDR